MFNKLKAFLLSSLLAVNLIGCSHKLINDPLPQAINSGYYNAEYKLNNKTYIGGSVLLVKSNASLSNYKLQVYGPDEGVIYLSSNRCGINKSLTYTKGKYTTFEFKDLFTSFQNCTLSIRIIPEYKHWKHEAVSIAGQQGFIYIRIMPENSNHELDVIPNNVIQLRSGDILDLQVISKPLVDVAFFRCKDPDPLIHVVTEFGVLGLRTSDLIRDGESCAVQIKDKDFGFTALIINSYSKDYQVLAIPMVSFTKNHFKVIGDTNVTLTDINSKYYYGNTAEHSYRPGINYTIRQYTTKGRSIVCSILDKKVECKQ